MMKRMMTLSREFLKSVSALVTLFVAFSAAINELQFENGNVNISWNYVPASPEIDFNISVKTTGYVAMGLTKTNSGMQNLALFAGGVDSSGNSYLKDYYATGMSTPEVDVKHNYTLLNATEANGVTTVRCKTKLDNQDDNHQLIQPGEELYIAWAYHRTSDNLTTHSSKGYSSEKHVLVPGNTTRSGNAPSASETPITSQKPPAPKAKAPAVMPTSGNAPSTSETPTTSQKPPAPAAKAPAPAAKAPAIMPTSVTVTILYLVNTLIQCQLN